MSEMTDTVHPEPAFLAIIQDMIDASIAGSGGAASGITYDNATSGLDGTDVQAGLDELAASSVALEAAAMTVVNHVADDAVVRPTAPAVYWIGSVEPVNAEDWDLWYDTSAV